MNKTTVRKYDMYFNKVSLFVWRSIALMISLLAIGIWLRPALYGVVFVFISGMLFSRIADYFIAYSAKYGRHTKRTTG